MVTNVIDTAQTHYIPLAAELETFLKTKYAQTHPDWEFEIEHVCDRWTFEAPEEISQEDISKLIDQIEAKDSGAR